MCVELIKNLVEKEFNLQLIRKTRRRRYVEARAVYYMLLRDKGRMSLQSISKTLGKNHATVIHSIKNFKDWMLYDTNLKSIYETIEKKTDFLIEMNPEAFGRTKTEKEMYEVAYEDIKEKMIEQEDLHKNKCEEMESKYRALRGRYRFLLYKLKKNAPKTYRIFNELETNNI